MNCTYTLDAITNCFVLNLNPDDQGGERPVAHGELTEDWWNGEGLETQAIRPAVIGHIGALEGGRTRS